MRYEIIKREEMLNLRAENFLKLITLNILVNNNSNVLLFGTIM